MYVVAWVWDTGHLQMVALTGILTIVMQRHLGSGSQDDNSISVIRTIAGTLIYRAWVSTIEPKSQLSAVVGTMRPCLLEVKGTYEKWWPWPLSLGVVQQPLFLGGTWSHISLSRIVQQDWSSRVWISCTYPTHRGHDDFIALLMVSLFLLSR